jgi:hypothetical protein
MTGRQMRQSNYPFFILPCGEPIARTTNVGLAIYGVQAGETKPPAPPVMAVTPLPSGFIV